MSEALGEKDGKPLLFKGDIDMRIARDGTWYHEGDPIKRHRLVKLFSTVLKRDEAGDYWLVTPVEQARIVVEDAPFVAVELRVEGSGRDQRLHFRTNVDDWVTADKAHPIRVVHDAESEEPSPYVTVRDNLEALMTRNVFYELAELAETSEEDGREVMGVWSEGQFFALGPAA